MKNAPNSRTNLDKAVERFAGTPARAAERLCPTFQIPALPTLAANRYGQRRLEKRLRFTKRFFAGSCDNRRSGDVDAKVHRPDRCRRRGCSQHREMTFAARPAALIAWR